MKKPTDAASWRVRVRSASFGLVVTRISVRRLRRKNLEFFGRKPTWSRTELFDNRDLTAQVNRNLILLLQIILLVLGNKTITFQLKTSELTDGESIICEEKSHGN